MTFHNCHMSEITALTQTNNPINIIKIKIDKIFIPFVNPVNSTFVPLQIQHHPFKIPKFPKTFYSSKPNKTPGQDKPDHYYNYLEFSNPFYVVENVIKM